MINKYKLSYNFKWWHAMSLACIFFITDVNASEGGPCKDYGECDQFKYSLNDMESLQSGASTFMNYCYGCHSLQYSRWGRVAPFA